MSDSFWIVAAICFFFYAVLIYPTSVKERIVIKALEVYEMELKAGVKESKIEEMMNELVSSESSTKEDTKQKE